MCKKIAIIGIGFVGIEVLENFLDTDYDLFSCISLSKIRDINKKIAVINTEERNSWHKFRIFTDKDIMFYKQMFSTYDKIYIVSAYVTREFIDEFWPLLDTLNPCKCQMILGYPLTFEGKVNIFKSYTKKFSAQNFNMKIIEFTDEQYKQCSSITNIIENFFDFLVKQLKKEIEADGLFLP